MRLFEAVVVVVTALRPSLSFAIESFLFLLKTLAEAVVVIPDLVVLVVVVGVGVAM